MKNYDEGEIGKVDYLINRFCSILEDNDISFGIKQNGSNVIMTFVDLPKELFNLFKNLKLDQQVVIQEIGSKVKLVPKDIDLEVFKLMYDIERKEAYLKLILKKNDYSFKINKIQHALINRNIKG